MNIFAIFETPEFFISKFNLYQSQNLYFSEILISISIILSLLGNLKIKKVSFYIYLIVLFNPYITIYQKFLSVIIIEVLTFENYKLIFKGLKHGVFINLLIGTAQIIKQNKIGLSKLGESNLDKNISQIAKFKLFNTEIIRAYGLTPHPNILAFLSLINPYQNQKIQNLVNFITFSGSASLSKYIKDIQNKNYLTTSLIILTIILIIKGENSINNRINEVVTTNSHNNFQPKHNIILDSIQNLNIPLLIGFTLLIYKNFAKLIFLIPIMLLDHLIISNYSCFITFIIYSTEVDKSIKFK